MNYMKNHPFVGLLFCNSFVAKVFLKTLSQNRMVHSPFSLPILSALGTSFDLLGEMFFWDLSPSACASK